MYQHQKADWKIFDFLFSSNLRQAFELLAYILFCDEYDIPYGIFRYYNQAGIETNPITKDKETIGFQAKYYNENTPLTKHESDLKKAIETSKGKHPDLTKLIFYLNKELSSSSKRSTLKPKFQTIIEDYGKTFNIDIEWRVPSNFEVHLLQPHMSHISDFFFNPNKGIKQFIDNMLSHSKTIINSIKSSIIHGNLKLKVEQLDIELSELDSDCIIIYGNSGCGKSGLIKDLYNSIATPCFAFKTGDFDVETIYDFISRFGSYSINDFTQLFVNNKDKYIIIDSAEKYFTLNSKSVFDSTIRQLVDSGWRIIFALRTAYKNNFINYVLPG